MQIATLIEPLAGRGFRASTRSPIEISVEAESRDEVIEKFQAGLCARLADGSEIINVELDVNPHPWTEFAGGLRDHPLLDEWEKAMADYRDLVDQEEAERDAGRDTNAL
jgi:hypothetical protein